MTELHGRHIAITRPENQAKRLSELILAAGGTPVSFPLIAISALEDYQPLRLKSRSCQSRIC
ncbi:uroporphyrinogen-III synthase [Methylobacillus glycogenes]|uniref:uroporphyrinogen-III synthase n=1 Tax=Methylobacillus glycogenes TaxID=406 RepID=UPI0034E1BE20